MKEKVEHKCRVCSEIFLYKSEFERHKSFHEKSESQQCIKCKKYFRRKDFFTKHVQTCQVFDCEEDNFVSSFAFTVTDVIDNEIEFHEQVFPQSDNNEIQNELDSESGMLLDYELYDYDLFYLCKLCHQCYT